MLHHFLELNFLKVDYRIRSLPLRDAGLIECEKTTTGQGAKPYIVRPTEKLKNELIEPIFDSIEQSVGVQYRKL
jgi:hypothetical protein